MISSSSYCATLYYPSFPLDRRKVEMFYIEMDYWCITLTHRISDWKFQSCEISATSLFITQFAAQLAKLPMSIENVRIPIGSYYHSALRIRSDLRWKIISFQFGFQSLLKSVINYRLVTDSIWFAFSTNYCFKNWLSLALIQFQILIYRICSAGSQEVKYRPE